MAQTLSSIRSTITASASSAKTRQNVTGADSIGRTINTTYSNVDIAYSITVVSTGASDVATLTVSSGVCAQTTGTPTISNSGVDSEGNTLTTAISNYLVLVECVVSGVCVVSGTQGLAGNLQTAGDWCAQSALEAAGTVILTFSASAAEYRITVYSGTA